MIQPRDLIPLRNAASDDAETEDLKARLRALRDSRSPFFLGWDDLDPIFHWKLRGQYRRVARHLRANPAHVFPIVTRAAFEVNDGNADYELEVRVGILTALRGVGVPVASAILALTEPQKYCVIDFRAWRAVFRDDRTSFGVAEYVRYLTEVRRFATELGWPPQEVDAAIWEYDRRHPRRTR